MVAFPVAAAEVIMQVPADVVDVYDGDTLTVDAYPWPGMIIRTKVRVAGIDTPEIRGKCDQEKAKARLARDRMASLAGKAVQLKNVIFGKYAGRVVAEVMTASGNAGDILIHEGLARRYDGGRRETWCP